MPALDQWEQRLRPYFTKTLRILAEIPLSQADIEDMRAGVRASIDRNGIAEATRFILHRYPHTFLVLLAGFAAHNTNQGYWDELARAVGVSGYEVWNSRWPYIFVEEIKRRGLPYFDREDASNYMVSTVRFHGGIPAYSLPDFFERLLLPTVKRVSLSEVPTKQAMTAVLRTAYFVDSPVINFLENSGSLGEQFFDSCRKMARHYLNHQGDLLPAASLNLPEYVVEAFGEFMERGEEEGQSLRLRKPVLGANPFGDLDRVWLKLPEQEIELRYAAGSLEWRVEWPGLREPEHVACQLLRKRQYVFIREEFFPIEAAPNQISVVLVYTEDRREELLRRWTLPLVPPAGRAPLLAFRQDGEMIRAGQALPADYLRLIYPHDTGLRIGGQGSQSEIYGRMYGAWQDWQIQEWNLSEAWSIEVVRNGQVLGPMVSVAGRMPEPELVGGTLSPFGSSDTPLYLGEPPSVKIPLRTGHDFEEELGKWQIELSSVWNTDPPVQFSGSLKQFTDQVIMEGGEDQIPSASLPLSCMLGSQPAGTFQMRINGPGSARKDFRLRLWQRLTVMSLPKRLLPAEQNSVPVTFFLRIPPHAACEPQAGAGDVEVREDLAGWKITAGPDVAEVNLNLTYQSAGKQTIRVPICIPIPRLHWTLALGAAQEKLDWTGHPIQKSAVAILQSETASLHIKAFGLGGLQNRLRFELVEVGETEIPVQEADFQKTAFSPDWLRVPLGQFSGSLKNECQQGRFDLVLLPRRDEPGTRVPLLLAPRSIEIKNVGLSQIDETTWQLTWHEDQPLKSRRFLLVPAWQPWQEPWEYKIPDDARGAYRLEDVALPHTRYHIYFYTAPGWEAARTTPPVDIKPHVVELCAPLHRLSEVEWQAHGTPEEHFRGLVEKICIFEDLGDWDNREAILSQILVPFNHLTNLRLILGLLEWLVSRRIESPNKKYLLKVAFHPNKVKAIMQRYKTSDPLLQRYFGLVRQGAALYGESALRIAERSDDPVIIHACMKQLLEREDEILILLVLDMIENARLSNKDAVELLSHKVRWAVEKLAGQQSSPQVDRLLAALLPQLCQEANLAPEFVTDLIMRSLPYENQLSIKVKYYETLVANEHEEGIRVVVQAAQDGVINQEEAERIVSIAPQRVFQVLETSPQPSLYERWIAWLAERFPGAAGVIRLRTRIQTPLGIGFVDRIEDVNGGVLQQTLLSSRSVRINLLVGDGAERFRIWLNLSDNTITFFEAQRAWQCPYCKFAHPDQRGIDRHYRQSHPGAGRVYRGIPATIPVDRADLEIVLQ